MKVQFSATEALDVAIAANVDATFSTVEEHPELGDRVVPADLRDWLARLRLLESVPFNYLVPDAELLPLESIRFFYLDRVWTDALVQGALSVGTVASADRAQLESVYPYVRDEVDEEERLIRLPLLNEDSEGAPEPTPQAPGGVVSGFLLRSRAVSGWPGLHVRAYREELAEGDDAQIPESDPRRVRLIRLERLAPAVLLGLFDGVPKVVHIEEPRQGIQFGVELRAVAGQPGVYESLLRLRDVLTAEELPCPPNDPFCAQSTVNVPFRQGSPGVLDMTELNKRMIANAGAHMGQDVDSAEFAMQVLQFPYRQVFGDPNQGTDIADVFRPSIALTTLKVHYENVLDVG
jgi:hypothetical protein